MLIHYTNKAQAASAGSPHGEVKYKQMQWATHRERLHTCGEPQVREMKRGWARDDERTAIGNK